MCSKTLLACLSWWGFFLGEEREKKRRYQRFLQNEIGMGSDG
jgi:hypothetical protein